MPTGRLGPRRHRGWTARRGRPTGKTWRTTSGTCIGGCTAGHIERSRRGGCTSPRRPLGIASVEDKIAQRAVVEVLNSIYEADFLGFSYGFRPGRSQHDALDALTVGIKRRKVNWVLDCDVADFFTRIDHSWLKKFLEHRIADPRMLRLIQKWVKAGVIEDGTWAECDEGTPQGATVSPLLAKV